MRNLNLKIIMILVGVILSMTLVAGMRMMSSVRKDQLEKTLSLTENQVSFTRHSLQIQIHDLAHQLIQLLERENAGVNTLTETYRLREQMGDFKALAWIVDGKTSFLAVSNELSSHMDGDFFEKQKDLLPLLSVKDHSIIWVRLTENNGQPLFGMMMEIEGKNGEKGIGLGLLNPQIFSEISGYYKVQNTELLLIDDKGFALAFTRPQYLGAQITHLPVVSRLLSQPSVSGSGETIHLDGNQMVYAFERLNESNLYLLLLNPLPSLRSFMKEYWVGLISMAVIVALFSILSVSFMVQRSNQGFLELKGIIRRMATGQNFLIPGKKIPEISDVRSDLMKLNQVDWSQSSAVSKSNANKDNVPVTPNPPIGPQPVLVSSSNEVIEKQEGLLREMSQGLVDSFRPSLTAILGHAQLARSKSGEDEPLKQHFLMIEQESRRLRGLLDNVESMTLSTPLELVPTNMQEVILWVLTALRNDFQMKGVQVIKNFQDNGLISVDVKSLRIVLEEILRNAIESMEGLGKREIEISTHFSNQKINLSIKDKGQGMEETTLKKIFEPFYTTHDRAQKSGLGLFRVQKLLKLMKAQIYVESKVNLGTQVRMEFPLIEQLLNQSHLASAPSEEPTTSAPSQLPQPSQSPQRELSEMSDLDFLRDDDPPDDFSVNIRSPKVKV